ncbi:MULTISPECIES: DUF5431 family protein [Citrobacter]|nr:MULTISPECIES: DUF5431 family protein [Citrobacter freundii complex]ELQ7908872.1 DUF5431 family protein [Citrobacter freundii]MCX2449609.1 DUF5431 family protein [Citrobacter freundii complex sp. 2022EL-00822]MCX2491797.1 DUF5431 family protein [Citrobacter freundii complex sp. 2022EL-00971]MDE9630579.1 FlmC family protein [Citrobacter freundii]MDE9730204.1 FlmC family protein [Citrobacter freundii]
MVQRGHYSLVLTGEEGHETATKHSVLVRINSVSHATDIYLPDPEITL